MGRIFEVRKATMFARWNRMAKQFAKIGKDITIAVRAGGPDPNSNPALRRVIQNARAMNMPKDKVESAIRRASGADAKDYEIVLYEGYAPHGVAVIVETATDNTNRTVASVRSIFSKYGGNLGTTGSVEYMFRRMGVFRLNPAGIDQDDLELYLIDHGLEETLLAAELRIERGQRSAGAPDDLGHAGGLVTVFEEDIPGGQEEGGAAHFCAAGLSRFRRHVRPGRGCVIFGEDSGHYLPVSALQALILT